MTTHEIQGVKLQVIETFSETMMERSAAFSVACVDYGKGVTEADSQAAWQEIQAITASPISSDEKFLKIGALSGTMQMLYQVRNPIKAILNVGYTFILLEDESPDKVTSKHLLEKMKLTEKNPAIRNFFLTKCLDMLQRMSVSSKDIKPEDFLKEGQHQIEHQLLRKIGSSLFNGR